MIQRNGIDKIRHFLQSNSIPDTPLLIEGMRQVGKTYVITQLCKKLGKSLIHIDLSDEKLKGSFFGVRHPDDLWNVLAYTYGSRLESTRKVVIFFDNIHLLPNLAHCIPPLAELSGKISFILSTLSSDLLRSQNEYFFPEEFVTVKLHPLSFSEFMRADTCPLDFTPCICNSIRTQTSIPPSVHHHILNLFRTYLVVGGLPGVVYQYFNTGRDLDEARQAQLAVLRLINLDLAEYDAALSIKCRNLFNALPIFLLSQRKRVRYKDIPAAKTSRASSYQREIRFLIDYGVVNPVWNTDNLHSIPESSGGNRLVKLFLSDVGLLSCQIEPSDLTAAMEGTPGICLNSLYENATVNAFSRINRSLYYFDRRGVGSIDIIFDWKYGRWGFQVKAGRNYKVFSASPELIRDFSADNLVAAVSLEESNLLSVDHPPVFTYPVYFSVGWTLGDYED